MDVLNLYQNKSVHLNYNKTLHPSKERRRILSVSRVSLKIAHPLKGWVFYFKPLYGETKR